MKKYCLIPVIIIVITCASLFPAAAPAHEEREGVYVPVIMYHSLTTKKSNQWTLPPKSFEADLKYLSENGYQTVGVSDLIAFVDEGAPLPEKPVMLTFDDGYYNNFTKALPLLESYDMKMVLSVIGEPTDKFSDTPDANETYGHVTWDQIRDLQQSGRVEISNHTYSLHKTDKGRNGCRIKKGESIEEYRDMLMEDVGKLQQKLEQNSDIKPVCFAYPFGSRCDEALNVLKEMGFRVTLSCNSKNNLIVPGDPDSLYDLGRTNRTSRKTAATILDQLKPA